MSIVLGCRLLLVADKFTDDIKALARGGANTGKCMPEIVKALGSNADNSHATVRLTLIYESMIMRTWPNGRMRLALMTE